MLTRAEVRKHATPDSCWLIIQGNVYDLTTFLNEHPGGPAIIRRHAGEDATRAFEQVHAIGIIEETLKPENNLGPIGETSAGAADQHISLDESAEAVLLTSRQVFKLAAVLNIRDFERAASVNLSKEAFACKRGALHWVCNMASCTKEEIARARAPNQTTYWQIYAMNDLAKSEREIREAVAAGYRGFALTVDAIRAGKRERDMRVGLEETQAFKDDEDEENETVKVGGVSASRAPVWSEFDWPSATGWLRGLTSLPIAIKGIQSWEDAALCMKYGVHPWLSNHGGRQLEGAPSTIETLAEIRQHCPEVFDGCDVIVDGGIRRGTDIVKALALGAKAVGLGRPFLYALSLGEAGVSRAFNILTQEMETAMALLGVEDVKDLGPQHVQLSGMSTRDVLSAKL
ncbi:hypothetical protein LTR85_009098 [Meristemomyces frigidus]|nr:hypothetical protein LTR85_009098 [Meristemomyces frigidus]